MILNGLVPIRVVVFLVAIAVPTGIWGQPPQRNWLVTRVGKSLDIDPPRVTGILKSIERLFLTVDCSGDISCPIGIRMKDLDFRPRYSGIITRPQEFDALHREKNAFVLIVDDIGPEACRGSSAEGPGRILGCAGSNWMAVVRSPRISPSIVWAHEFSHTVGNIHRKDYCALMRPSADSERNRAVNMVECTNIRGTPPPPARKTPKRPAPKSTAPRGTKTATTTPTTAEDPKKRV